MCQIIICLFSLKCQWALSVLAALTVSHDLLYFYFAPERFQSSSEFSAQTDLLALLANVLLKWHWWMLSSQWKQSMQFVISSLRDNKWSRKLTIPAVTLLWVLVFWDTFYWLTLLFGELLLLIMGSLNGGVCVDFLWVLDSILSSSMTL